jgi:uncharacterized membrane protein YkoI
VSLIVKAIVRHNKLTHGSFYVKGQYSIVTAMMKHIQILLIIVMLLVAAPLRASDPQNRVAHAQATQDQDRAYKATKAAGLLPYSLIRKVAEDKIGGKIISQKLVRTNTDNWIYQLRIRKKDGRVVFAVINAKNGEILTVK